MYFKSRAEAGRLLAAKLDHYKFQNVAVVALSPGAVIVGAQIAMRLHANLSVLLTQNVYLPGEHEAIAALSSVGTFTYNNMFSPGELEEMKGEYHQFIEQQRMEHFHRLNQLVGDDGEIKKEYLRHHVVILVSDGLNNGFSLDIAGGFMKTIAIKRLVIASPLASVNAIDQMHLLGDEICLLSPVDNNMETNHYYEDNNIPKTDDLFKIMRNISLNWNNSPSKSRSKDKASTTA